MSLNRTSRFCCGSYSHNWVSLHNNNSFTGHSVTYLIKQGFHVFGGRIR